MKDIDHVTLTEVNRHRWGRFKEDICDWGIPYGIAMAIRERKNKIGDRDTYFFDTQMDPARKCFYVRKDNQTKP